MVFRREAYVAFMRREAYVAFMKRVVPRLLGIGLLLGQLVQVSGGWLCGRAHREDCHRSMTQGGSIAATPSSPDAPCPLGPCAAPFAAVASLAVRGYKTADASASAESPPTMPASITRIPVPPPPQV